MNGFKRGEGYWCSQKSLEVVSNSRKRMNRHKYFKLHALKPSYVLFENVSITK